MKRPLSIERRKKILCRNKKRCNLRPSLTNHKNSPSQRTNMPHPALYMQTAQPPREFNKSLKERLRPGQHLHHIGVVTIRAGGVPFDCITNK